MAWSWTSGPCWSATGWRCAWGRAWVALPGRALRGLVLGPARLWPPCSCSAAHRQPCTLVQDDLRSVLSQPERLRWYNGGRGVAIELAHAVDVLHQHRLVRALQAAHHGCLVLWCCWAALPAPQRTSLPALLQTRRRCGQCRASSSSDGGRCAAAHGQLQVLLRAGGRGGQAADVGGGHPAPAAAVAPVSAAGPYGPGLGRPGSHPGPQVRPAAARRPRWLARGALCDLLPVATGPGRQAPAVPAPPARPDSSVGCRVDLAVDIFAFGILLWEVRTSGWPPCAACVPACQRAVIWCPTPAASCLAPQHARIHWGQSCTAPPHPAACALQIVTGDLPIKGAMRDVDVPTECPPSVKALIVDCMRGRTTDRPAASEVQIAWPTAHCHGPHPATTAGQASSKRRPRLRSSLHRCWRGCRGCQQRRRPSQGPCVSAARATTCSCCRVLPHRRCRRLRQCGLHLLPSSQARRRPIARCSLRLRRPRSWPCSEPQVPPLCHPAGRPEGRLRGPCGEPCACVLPSRCHLCSHPGTAALCPLSSDMYITVRACLGSLAPPGNSRGLACLWCRPLTSRSAAGRLPPLGASTPPSARLPDMRLSLEERMRSQSLPDRIREAMRAPGLAAQPLRLGSAKQATPAPQ